MLLSLRPFHVGFADIAQIVNEEGDPQPGIPGEAVQPGPCPGNEKGVDQDRMHPKCDLRHNFAVRQGYALFPESFRLTSAVNPIL